MSPTAATLPSSHVVVPFTSEYDGLRQLFNAAVDDYPAAVVRCRSSTDVALCVHAANEFGLRVVPRNGAHKITGYGLDAFQGIVLDLSPMRAWSIDAESHLCVEAGAMWPQFFRHCLDRGLAPISAEDPTVGVSGFTLGGGYGWFSRSRGLAIDQIVELEMVTASADTIVVNAQQNPDLFWAMRGAGCGNFGVVTRLTLAMSSCSPDIFCGHAVYDAGRVYDIFQAHQEIMVNAPDELSVSIICSMHEGQQILMIEGAYDGPPAEGAKAMQPYLDLGPVRQDLRVQSFADFQFGSSAHRGLGGSWDTGYLREQTLCDKGMAVIADFMKTMPQHAPKTVAGLEYLGGRIKSLNPESSCFPHREAMWNFDIFSSWNLHDKAMKASSLDWATAFYAAMQPWLSGGVYSNYPSLELEDWGRAYYGDNLDRLAALAVKWDPDRRFYQTQGLTEYAAAFG